MPVPLANEAVVDLELCTVCGSDLHTITGKRIEPTPTILGHEILGVISSIGSPAPKTVSDVPLQIGDRVTWSTCISCGNCERCRNGLPQKCLTVEKYGHNVSVGRAALRGGFSEKILLSAGTSIVKIDSDIPAETIAPVNCSTATVAAAFRAAGEPLRKRILIIGAGLLGLTATAFAKTKNALLVDVCDIDSQRLGQAKLFGASKTIHLNPEGTPDAGNIESCSLESKPCYDLILDFAGSSASIERALPLADIGAKVILVGSVMKSPSIAIDPEKIVRSCTSIHGVHNYSPNDLNVAVQFLTRYGNRFPFSELVSKTFQLGEIQDAIEFAIKDKPIRIGITP